MVPKDFGEFGEEREMPSDMQEKTPGVYMRADENESPHELDMLWSNSRGYQREERSPLIPFIVGVLVGAIITALVFMLFVIRPQVKTSDSDMMAPITDEVNSENAPATQNEAGGNTSGASASPARATTGAKSYTVRSGDTLGHIAEQVYGSSAPQYVEKIQRANHMKSPDDLQLDQKLIIPPKDY
jgi:LysM repeat protein